MIAVRYLLSALAMFGPFVAGEQQPVMDTEPSIYEPMFVPRAHARYAGPEPEYDSFARKIITDFQELSLAYEDIIFSIQDAVRAGQWSFAKPIVDMYGNITYEERDDQNGPKPTGPVSDFEQYLLLSTYYNLVAIDKQFFHLLAVNKSFFWLYSNNMRDLLQAQIPVINGFNQLADYIAPKVSWSIRRNSDSLGQSLNFALSAYGHYS